MTDCWKTIGVQGDGSCVTLTEHVHCRNCPVYSRAARSVLDVDAPPGYVAHSTRHFAQPKEDVRGDTLSVLIFRIGNEWLALPTQAVWEVTDLKPIHSLPHRTGGLALGLASIRGELLVCVSLGRLLGIDGGATSRADLHPRMRLLVMRREGARVVTVTDEVDGVHHTQPGDVRPLPATVANGATPHSRGVIALPGRTVGLLDERRLFQDLEGRLA
jgi:chemotaxis-related protein WspD